MSFEKLIGNKEIKKTLKNIIETNTIAHNYMFLGTSGIGKKLFAIEFSKMILCENKENKPCNKCKSCIEINNNNHPDFIIVKPEKNMIKIDQIREIIAGSIEKPIVSNKKVYLIENANTMNETAQNCFLKTLEEPNENTIIILIANSEGTFLNTIKSRCLKLQFKKIENSDLKNYLEKNYNFSNITDTMLKSFEGSIEKALKTQKLQETCASIEEIFLNIEDYTFLEYLDKTKIITKEKEDIIFILEYINNILFMLVKNNKYKYLSCIEIVNKTIRNIKLSGNLEMNIDNLLFTIYENIK